MNWNALLLVLLQCLGCFCFPTPDVTPMANKALEAAQAEFNTRQAGASLYRASHANVKRVIAVGLNTYDLLLKMDMRETQCLKASGQAAATCALKTTVFTPVTSCSSRVRINAAAGNSAQVVTLQCALDSSSSSSESNEDFSWGRQRVTLSGFNQVNNP